MSKNTPNSQNSFRQEHGKNSDNLQQLKDFVKQSYYIDIKDQASVCKRFDLPYQKSVFSKIYRQRFFNYLKSTIATRLIVSTETGIPEKILCQYKAYYQKRNLLKVAYLDVCPISKSKGVQFLTTNPKLVNNRF